VEPYRKAGIENREDEASRTVRDRLEGHLLPTSFDSTRVRQELLSFFADRLKVALREQGVRHDLIDAVFALGGEDDLVRLLDRVEALRVFLKDENGANLLTAYRRAANIVAIEEKKDKARYDDPVVEADLRAPEELALNRRLGSVSQDVAKSLSEENFQVAMVSLAGLRESVDPFFDKVTVNDSDPKLRANRLRLLSRIRATLGQVADFSRIEG
jgi:glycyl-tRNA synthetase beta chain